MAIFLADWFDFMVILIIYNGLSASDVSMVLQAYAQNRFIYYKQCWSTRTYKKNIKVRITINHGNKKIS